MIKKLLAFFLGGGGSGVGGERGGGAIWQIRGDYDDISPRHW